MTRELDALLRSAQPASLQGDWDTDSAHALDDSALFATPTYAAFDHVQRLDRAGLLSLVTSRSYVIALDPSTRSALLDRVGELFDNHAGPDGSVALPYRAECFRCAVRRPHP